MLMNNSQGRKKGGRAFREHQEAKKENREGRGRGRERKEKEGIKERQKMNTYHAKCHDLPTNSSPKDRKQTRHFLLTSHPDGTKGTANGYDLVNPPLSISGSCLSWIPFSPVRIGGFRLKPDAGFLSLFCMIQWFILIASSGSG